MIKSERLIRDRNRLRFAWEQRKQMCQFYAIVVDKKDDKIEELECRIEQLETIIALHQRSHCEAE